MEAIKKSFNINPDIAQRLDDFIRRNPGVSFTLIVNQAIETWLKDPRINLQLNTRPVTEDDITRFMKDNKDLMDKLAK